MSTDLFTRVFYNDGEELTFGDLLNDSSAPAAQLTDQILENLIGNFSATTVDPTNNTLRGANASTLYAYCPSVGGAYPRPGSTNAKVQISPGVLFQKVANQTGTDSTLLAYSFVGTEEVTIANGATNPRVDLVQMQLQLVTGGSATRSFKDATTGIITSQTLNKTRRVQCTLSVKQGTPGATPTVPDPDAGFVAIASVEVATTWAAGTAIWMGCSTTSSATATMHDQRMPIKVKQYLASNSDAVLLSGTTYSAATGKLSFSANNNCVVKCPSGGLGRVVGFTCNGDATVGNPFLTNGVLLGNCTAQGGFQSPASNSQWNTLSQITNVATPQSTFYRTFDGAPNGGLVISFSSVNKICRPMWTSGDSHPFGQGVAAQFTPVNNTNAIGVLLKAAASLASTITVGPCLFYIAESL
jgi:hypothetical protein